MSKQHDITPGEEAPVVSSLNNGDLPWTVHISRHVPSRLTHVTYFTARARWWYVCALPSEDSDMFGNGCCTCCLLSISQLFPHHTKTAGMRTKYLKFLLKHKWNHATACTAQHDRHPSWVSSQTQKLSKMTQTFQGRTSVIKISGMKWSRNLEICTSEFTFNDERKNTFRMKQTSGGWGSGQFCHWFPSTLLSTTPYIWCFVSDVVLSIVAW